MMKRNLRSDRLVNLALRTADEERQENEEEFEREKHFFRNEEYPGLAPGSDPESDAFSDNGSSDYYQPSTEEELSEGNTSDSFICDESYQRETNLLPQNTKQHDLHQNQTHFMLKNTTEHRSHQPQAYTTRKRYLTPQTIPEYEPHQQQTNIMLQINAEQETRQLQTYITQQTNAEQEPRQLQTYITQQTNAEQETRQLQTYITQQTNAEQEPRQLQTYITQQTNAEQETRQLQTYITQQTNAEQEPRQLQTYITQQTNAEQETRQLQTYITQQTNAEQEPRQLQTYITQQTSAEQETRQLQTYITQQTNAEQEPRQLQTYITQQTNAEQETRQLQTHITPQTIPEYEPHQQQTNIMLQINAEQETRQLQTYITQQTNAEQEPRQLQTYMMPQKSTELLSHQQQGNAIPQTIEGHQSQAAGSNNSAEKGRNRDFCFYCETHVLNFARHIIRQHYLEVDVQKILAYPKKSRTRRNLITDLKKKGNYISNVVRCERPMRKEKRIDQDDYLPCSNCLGFYARKQLWKHKKKCDPEHKGSQAEAQNFMCRNSLHTPSKSLQKVFSRMRADKIAFVVKQDPIICQFGENYIKIHREEYFINVTSRKMRELAKLLIEVRKIKPEINTFFDALKPQNYDLLVAASKIVAKYDETTDRYCSPTYAINISTSIKQCCNIAIMKILKTETCIKSAEMQADLRTLVQLIESNWKFDVSSNAADDLNLKKWNKVTIVPLASDLKLLKDHLCAIAQKSAAQLREGENYQNTFAYNELVETVFCRALLLNRRRPGELQRLMLSTYVENEHEKEYKYEEFDRTLTATERILVQRFKRIVIRGKRSRGVPVLFSTDVQQDLDLLISLRSKYVDINNKFLFAKPSSMTYLCGYKVLQKHVKLSGAKNPEAISSTKLRKHLATLTQLFNMSENDIEQLSNFMGHTTGVHRRNYRLPDDIFQTAKISKLLILMEDGKADSFKGKSLDEINLNMEEELEGEGLEKEDVLNFAESRNTLQELESVMATDMSATAAQDVATPFSDNATSVCEPLANISNIISRSTKKKRVLVPWTSQQKNIVINHFKRHIRSKKPPKRHECDELKDLHPELLKNKDWLKIKVFIQNYYTKH